MVKANELRIGNIINVINRAPVVVTADHIKSISEGDQDYSPIELTPEWLERCGFIKINSNVPLLMRMPPFDRYRQFRWDYEGFKIETTGSGWIWPFDHVKYVHQIQNLFFALTNEELKIEL